ncbi:ADP-ribose pyrophosphatase YjhB (NUDIX family) [Kineothrix alysoides]|uniref:ADP-ribose pyrophosphatase YjhB (NUDIX family) n=1 Tax=Kineothrix alysoides TaxID=1469948 RepID=A0A4V2QBF3_9FIRM|nr:NUDIX hydrolase [Kineothrix alysoides]TCL56192.1 ADP-ribose pyrophosphatase YjhB (NUDIX family) [Kineothrix alysoides]
MELTNDLDMLIKLAMELQSIAQNGLTYTKDHYDQERFERVREISAQIMAMKTGFSIEKVKDLFCNETGYQTPKIETRAAMFSESKILLVKEQGKWALPGGWIDYNETIATSTRREVKEETGLDIEPLRIIAIQDRNKHNWPKFAYGICKVFILCSIVGGSFQPNFETTESQFFLFDELPILDEDKTTYSQIQMCFEAFYNEKWEVIFD